MEQKKRKTEKGMPPPQYDEVFKAGAVRLAESVRDPDGQASRLNRERQRIRELEGEVRALRKHLAKKEEIIDVLKKSVGILSKP